LNLRALFLELLMLFEQFVQEHGIDRTE